MASGAHCAAQIVSRRISKATHHIKTPSLFHAEGGGVFDLAFGSRCLLSAAFLSTWSHEIVGKKMDPRVEKAISIIKGDLSKDMPIGELARTVNLSTSHLNHLFKQAVGLTITRYIRLLRMERAKGLLETTFLTVKEIGSDCGLKDESHFVQNFKAAHGLTPLRYRRHYHSTQAGEDDVAES